jgi:DNA-binding transcriptional ArsR family regulator
MENPLDDAAHADRCANVLKAVAHPLRLRIVAALCQGERHVSRLAELLGASQSTISQQLRILRMNGLVAAVRRDGYVHYSLTEPRLHELVNCVGGCKAAQR